MKKKEKEYNKPRPIRLSDSIWNEFEKTKPRDISWDLHIKNLLDAIKYFKNF